MGLSLTDYRASVEAPIVADRIILGMLCCSTGYCGTDSTEVHWFEAGENLEEFAREQAIENASSFGFEGDTVCMACGEVSSSGVACDSCDSDDLEWQDNDDVCGVIYLFNPLHHMGYHSGGGDETHIVNLLFDAGLLRQEEDSIIANTLGIVGAMAGERSVIIPSVDKFLRADSTRYGTFTRIVWE